MTRQRNDNCSTEFGLWLRRQPEIDSHLGYVATNIDFMWTNYKNGNWMLLEEKRYGSRPTFSQREQFKALNNACKSDSKYRGMHLIVFEHTSPEDGRIWLDNAEITKEELITFLKTLAI